MRGEISSGQATYCKDGGFRERKTGATDNPVARAVKRRPSVAAGWQSAGLRWRLFHDAGPLAKGPDQRPATPPY